jgi:hypothetical protein
VLGREAGGPRVNLSIATDGHYRFPDGSVLRVDLEMGRWVGTLYAPSMTIKTQIIDRFGDLRHTPRAEHIAS